MRRILLFILLLAGLPAPSFGWNLADHREISKLSLQDVAHDWELDHPVPVHPLTALMDKIRELRIELGDPWHFASFLQVNPTIDIGHLDSYSFEAAGLKDRKEMTPLEILTNYATDPDDGRDQDLFVRDEHGIPRPVYPDQKWFGFISGSKSQAFRHIEKPPFHLNHPIATFGFPFRKLGEASRRAEIYHQAARLAFALGEDYWGWRFLANAFHYLEDLHQPYHSGQITPTLLKKGLTALKWGWKEKGLMGTVAHIVSNSHRFFESYVENPKGKDDDGKESARKLLGGTDLAPYPGSFEFMASGVRDASNLLYGPLTEAVSEISSQKLVTDYEYRSDEKNADDPLQFLNEGPSFVAANHRLFEIVQDRFASAGKILRTAVKVVLDERQSSPGDPNEILSNLEKLLGPSPFHQESEENP